MRAGNDVKRSSPLSSAGVLSSEGLCYGILGTWAPRNLRSIAHRTDETVQIFRSASLLLLQIHTDSLDLLHKRPSRSDTLADCHFCLRTDAQLPLVIVKGEAVTVSSQKMFRELHIFCCSPCWFVPSQPPKGGAMNVWAGLCF